MALDVLKNKDKDIALTEANLAMTEALYFTAIKVEPGQTHSMHFLNLLPAISQRPPFFQFMSHF